MAHKMYELNLKDGIINKGNSLRIKRVMQKAYRGEGIVTAFLGGSITQGCHSSRPDTCYAALVHKWWEKKFPGCKAEFINAGIGATTSLFGAARVRQHVLSKDPDFILTEFAVNDENTELYKESYEGLIRTILKDDNLPALMLMNNVCYDTGISAEEKHLEIAKHYDLPMVSMKTTILREIQNGSIKAEDITPDNLHPNDDGHELVASVITYYLDTVYEEAAKEGLFDSDVSVELTGVLPDPVTADSYENALRIKNYNMSDPGFNVELNGFRVDDHIKADFLDIFSGGFEASQKGDSITFKTVCSGMAAQYKKTIDQPAPVAMAIIDDDEDNAVILDANFDEDWGDCLYIDVLKSHMELKEHKVEIRITETHEDDRVPFYLTSLIVCK